MRASVAERLGARLALLEREPALAVELAERALGHAERCRGWRDETPRFLVILAHARHKAGVHRTAQALETRALEQVRQIASTIEDRGRQKSWLSSPRNREVLSLADPASVR